MIFSDFDEPTLNLAAKFDGNGCASSGLWLPTGNTTFPPRRLVLHEYRDFRHHPRMTAILLCDPLCFEKVVERVGHRPGCYTLRLLREDGSRHPIPRFLDVDEEARLYIGASDSLPRRIAQLKIATAAPYGWGGYKGQNHVAGRKLAKLALFTNLHPFERLEITVEAAPSTEDGGALDHMEMEGRLFRAYFDRFGEHPPLNG
jgi:hypothetical protein